MYNPRILLSSNLATDLCYSGWSFGSQHHFDDIHSLHPSYLFNSPEVVTEYKLLNDFLSNSLLDDGGVLTNDESSGVFSDPILINSAVGSADESNGQLLSPRQPLGTLQTRTIAKNSIPRPTSVMPTSEAQETYYMTAADPSGSDTPEERMNKLLRAKYEAGLLRPFNYVKGYARLQKYMDQHMESGSRQRILRRLDNFRPKFRERMQALTDIELVLVETWFERSLMEYDRVFASMAVPACCWRRTGEIFRGNKEMAQLIHVPIEQLRDVSL